MKNYGRRVAATAMLVAGLTTGAVPAFAAAGGASTPSPAQERSTVAQCLTAASVPAVRTCLQDAVAAGRLTGRTDVPAVVAAEQRRRGDPAAVVLHASP
ncbi:MAG: hypothetical protein JWR20_1899, partial [Marmoricola sp.]|nr:hypothetical protein [Marmoricola sp.]